MTTACMPPVTESFLPPGAHLSHLGISPTLTESFMMAVMIQGLSSLSVYYTLGAVLGALFVLVHLSYSAPFHPSLLSGVHTQPPTPPFQCLFTDCSLCQEHCSYLSQCCELKQDPEH